MSRRQVIFIYCDECNSVIAINDIDIADRATMEKYDWYAVVGDAGDVRDYCPWCGPTPNEYLIK